MQPRSDGIAPSNRRSFAGQKQEGGLKDILGVLLVVQQPPTDIENEGAVTLNESGESVFLALADEPLEKIAVGQNAFGSGAGQPLNVSQEGAQLGLRHDKRLR